MNKKINEKDRMQKLVRSFEEKNEILKESNEDSADENILLKESGRFKEIARIDEWVTNPKANKVSKFTGPQSTTVNSFIPSTTDQNVKMYNPNYTYLQSNEALALAIKRAIESGAPINNLGFYEEVNWHLNNMGFNAMQPLDIKTSLKKMVND
jgi:hypothetical protein